MAKSRPLSAGADPLRNSLDELAARLVKTAMDDKEASSRTLAESLKAAAAWWGMSRGKMPADKDPAGNAWEKYTQNFTKGEADGAPH
jgi:hypothetical protein